MQNKTRKYAKALASVLEKAESKSEAEKIAKRFKHLLYKRGMVKKSGQILQEFSRILKEKDGREAVVVSALKLESKTKNKIEKNLAEKGYRMEEKVDPSLIGGIALILGNEYLIDGTLKGKLKRLEKIIN